MRILYLIRDPYPTSRPDIWSLFGVRLAERGLKTDIVAIRRGTDPAPADKWPAGDEIVVPRTRFKPLASVQSFWHDIKALRRGNDYDAVVVRDKILSAAAALLLVEPKKVFYWMSFPFPTEDRLRARAPGAGRLFSVALAVRGWVTGRLLDRFVVPRAAAVFVQSNAMLDDVAARTGRRDGLVAIPMGVDPAMFPPLERDERRQSPDETLRLVYVGSLDRARRIDFLLDVLQRLRTEHPTRHHHLSLIGGASSDEEFEWVRQRITDMGLDELVTMTGQVAMSQACRLAQQCDVGLSAIPRGPLFDVSSPTKTVEYLAMGLPVVVNDIPDQAYLVESTGAGLCVPMDVAEFANAIGQLRNQYVEFSDRTATSRDWLIAERGYPALADRVARVLANGKAATR